MNWINTGSMKKHIISIMTAFFCWGAAQAGEPEKGYRGFVEWNTEFLPQTAYRYSPAGPYEKYTEVNWLYGISTTHGYQFNPHLFVGGGVWLEFGAGAAGHRISEVIFAQVRTDWTFGKVPLYADLRLGGTLFGRNIDNEVDKLLISPTVGYRLDFGKRLCLNFGAGVAFHGVDGGYHESAHYTWKPFPAIRVGIEF